MRRALGPFYARFERAAGWGPGEGRSAFTGKHTKKAGTRSVSDESFACAPPCTRDIVAAKLLHVTRGYTHGEPA